MQTLQAIGETIGMAIVTHPIEATVVFGLILIAQIVTATRHGMAIARRRQR